MSRDLYERLRHLKRTAAVPRGSSAGAARRDSALSHVASGGASPPAGWRVLAPNVFERETVEPFLHPELPAAAADAAFESLALGRRVDLRSLRFMDTETTGLSGGAGTAVFLAGSARLTAGGLHVRQVFLGDFPAEPDFLRALSADLGGVWVSYNGKAFDARLLETRFLMNGLPPMEAEHLDLLTWSRRLWRRRIGPCALSDIEREVLARDRVDDVPGIEIPERYFRYLRTGEPAELLPVFEHHYHDMVSLVHLFFRIEAVLSSPLSDESVDFFRLGRLLLARGHEAAFELLEREARAGEEAAAQAAVLLSRAYRRAGRSDLAIRALTGCPAGDALAVTVELSKVYEHDLRDAAAARGVVEAFLERTGSAEESDLLSHRLARLVRKTGEEDQAPGPPRAAARARS